MGCLEGLWSRSEFTGLNFRNPLLVIALWRQAEAEGKNNGQRTLIRTVTLPLLLSLTMSESSNAEIQSVKHLAIKLESHQMPGEKVAFCFFGFFICYFGIEKSVEHTSSISPHSSTTLLFSL